MPVPVAPGRWPVLGHTPSMLRRRAGFTSSLHEVGDVVTVYLGPMRAQFVTSSELTHQVLVADAASYDKGAMFDKFRPYLGNGLLLSGGATHRRQRRLVKPAFRRERIDRYVETMARAATALTSSWRPGSVRVVEEDMQALAVTVVGEALFSTEIGQRAIDEVRRSIFLIIKQGMVRALSPAFVEKLPVPANRRFDEAVARMRAIVLEVIAAWRAEGVDHGDLLSTLLMARDADGAAMSDDAVHDEVLTLLTAGIETTALALAWVFHELARNADVEARLHAEVDDVLGGRAVTAADLPRLTYTMRVVDEVLRTYPVWFLMRRAVTDVELGGQRFPAGTEVIVSPHAQHFDPRNHPDPHRFDPDRWAPGRAELVPRGGYVPFGAGIRQCLGNTFAQAEIAVTLATVVSRWRLVPVPSRPVRVKFTSAAYPVGLHMVPVPRS